MVETKEVELYRTEYIKALYYFGWKKIKEISKPSGRQNHKFAVFERDTSINNYEALKSLESEYSKALYNKKTYNPINIKAALISLCFFIIPGLVYIIFKNLQKSKIKKHNNECEDIMTNAINKAKELI